VRSVGDDSLGRQALAELAAKMRGR
jgi:hypothetical protein